MQVIESGIFGREYFVECMITTTKYLQACVCDYKSWKPLIIMLIGFCRSTLNFFRLSLAYTQALTHEHHRRSCSLSSIDLDLIYDSAGRSVLVSAVFMHVVEHIQGWFWHFWKYWFWQCIIAHLDFTHYIFTYGLYIYRYIFYCILRLAHTISTHIWSSITLHLKGQQPGHFCSD